MLKDHYRILGVPSGASPEAVKKAFRTLALAFHPDRNPEPSAAVRFREIQEAYAVLSDPAKAAAYRYEYRLRHGYPHTTTETPQNREELLEMARRLYTELPRIDPFRADFDRISYRIAEILTPDNMALLQAENAVSEETRQFISRLLSVMDVLPLSLLKGFLAPLQNLANHSGAGAQVTRFMTRKKRQYYWNRYKIWIALMLALLFCIVLYLTGKR